VVAISRSRSASIRSGLRLARSGGLVTGQPGGLVAGQPGGLVAGQPGGFVTVQPGGVATDRAVLVVGHAARDVVDDDPRGWRLGGSVAYVALTLTRLGIAARAVIGLDETSAEAKELDLLSESGVEINRRVFETAPVLRNIETPTGRRQECVAIGPSMHPRDVPAEWQTASTWALVPILGEIAGPTWAGLPPPDAFVAVGWQGLLREARAGGALLSRPPAPDALLERADLTVVSADDLRPAGPDSADPSEPADPPDSLARLATLFPRPGQRLIVTSSARGGTLLARTNRGWATVAYPAAMVRRAKDPTGAGDVFLGAYLATLVDEEVVPIRLRTRPAAALAWRLRFAATVATMSIGGLGVRAIPTREAVLRLVAPRD
jgi:sugar/nucleoside kinase (ribokinase family)